MSEVEIYEAWKGLGNYQDPPFPIYMYDTYVLCNLLGMYHRMPQEFRDKCNNGDWFMELEWRIMDVLVSKSPGYFLGNNFGDKFTVREITTPPIPPSVTFKVERKLFAEWRD